MRIINQRQGYIWIIGIALVNPFALTLLGIYDHGPTIQWLMDSPTPYQMTATDIAKVWGLSSAYFALILVVLNYFSSAQYTIGRAFSHYLLATVIGILLPLLAMYISIGITILYGQ
ncbi:membrane hypothetical protein [Vibrio parahaemolyticus]